MSKKIELSLIVSCLGLGLVLTLLLVETRRGPSDTAVSRPDIGGAFSLIDHDGVRVSDADYAGRPLLIYFGFTYCPDVCPLSLDIMGAALQHLKKTAPKKEARLQPLFISVDPARDTPAQMKDYVSYFHPRLIGLTGTPEQIDAVKRAFRIYAAKTPGTDENGNYNVDHSSFFYLMDGRNRYIAHFSHTMAAPDIAAGIAAKLP